MKMIKLGTILFTKDGRKIGNAIVKTILYSDIETIEPIVRAYEIETDFGNNLILTENEIRGFFRVSIQRQDYSNWLFDKVDLILNGHK
jgi:hypothetical protein